MATNQYEIKLSHFEGPFDLLLFFVERDELNIYDIPITKLIEDFLLHIRNLEKLNIELASEFILFVSTLMRIKEKMLIPLKEIDEVGNEIDPREELVNKIIEYKKFKEVAAEMAKLEEMRVLVAKRGNLNSELVKIGNAQSEGTEIQTLTLFKLMRTFEKTLKRFNDKMNKPIHVVEKHPYTMESSRNYLLDTLSQTKSVAFELVFSACENRIHAIFLFLSLLELIQQNFMTIMVGNNKNNFIVEYIEPENRPIGEA